MARRLIIRPHKDSSFNRTFPSSSGSGWPVYEFEGDFDFEVEELRDYVQVEFVTPIFSSITGAQIAKGRLYTYVDPGLDLKIGDLVDVPSNLCDSSLAIVRKLGPDDAALAEYIVKEVTARYAKIESPTQAGLSTYGAHGWED